MHQNAGFAEAINHLGRHVARADRATRRQDHHVVGFECRPRSTLKGIVVVWKHAGQTRHMAIAADHRRQCVRVDVTDLSGSGRLLGSHQFVAT